MTILSERGVAQVNIRKAMSLLTAVMLAVLALPLNAFADSVNVASAPMVYSTEAKNGMVRVMLSSLGTVSRLDVSLHGAYTISGNQKFTASNETVSFVFQSSSGQVTMYLDGAAYSMGREVSLRRHAGSSVSGFKIAQAKKPGNLYPGDLILTAQWASGGYRLYPVAHVYMESYLYGVLPYEMGNSSAMEALKAQAVAARTYTLNKMESRSGYIYDVVDTTNDQVYYGNSDSTANCTAAVNATKGIVLMNSGHLTNTFYTASNGGQTESALNAWGTLGYDYLTVKDDPFDKMNSASVLRKVTVYSDFDAYGQNASLQTLLNQRAMAVLSANGYNTYGAQITRINAITPHTPMYKSPSRVYTLLDFDLSVSTTVGEVRMTVTLSIFDEVEKLLGMSINTLKNELWSVSATSGGFVLQARRFGHGVGMSQRGAMQMGALGYTYDQILGFYYENCQRVQCTFTQTILSQQGSDTITSVENPADITPSGGVTATVKLVGTSDVLPIRYTPDVQGKILTTVSNGGIMTALSQDSAWTKVQLGGVIGYVPTSSVRLSGQVPQQSSHAATNITKWAEVASSGSLNLRKTASLSAPVISSMPKGAVLCVFDVSGSWAHVQYGGQKGYASTDFLRMCYEWPGNISSSASVATVQIPSGSGSVNLRKTASTTGALLTTVAHGQTVQVLTNDGSWCQVSWQGYNGYIMTSFLSFGGESTLPPETDTTPSQPELNAGEVEAVVKTVSSALNLRQSPSTSSAVVAVLPRGERVVVTSRGGEWSAVRYGGVSGYVMTQYLSFPQSSDTVTAYAFVTTASSSLNLRSGPQTGSAIVTMLPKGARVGVIAWDATGWSKVKYDQFIGYAKSEYLTLETQTKPDTPAPSGETAVINVSAGNLNLRAGADYSAPVLAAIPKGTTVNVLMRGDTWTQISWQSFKGYVATAYLKFPEAASYATVSASSGLNLRETASSAARVLAVIPAGQKVELLELHDLWYKVRYNGLTGYVMKRYLDLPGNSGTQGTQTSQTGWIVTTITGGANVRQTPSASGMFVNTLAPGTQVTITGTSGDWTYVRWNNVEGYVLSRYVTTTKPTQAQTTTKKYVNTSVSGLNLRQQPDTTSAIVANLPRGTQVTVNSVSGQWSYITCTYGTGYVLSTYLADQISDSQPQQATANNAAVYDPTLIALSGWKGMVLAQPTLNIRSWCDAAAPAVGSVPCGATVTVKRIGDTWCEISWEGMEGYCMTRYLDLKLSY